jgi:hypothetical protein
MNNVYWKMTNEKQSGHGGTVAVNGFTGDEKV